MKKEYFTKKDTQILKGAMALLILAHHIYQRMPMPEGTITDYVFRSLGYLCVAVFFFISGYGITLSNKQSEMSGRSYMSSFLRSRVLSLYVCYILLILLYAFVLYIFDVPIPENQLIISFLIGGTIVGGGWYIQTLLLFYLIWWISKMIFGQKAWIMVFFCVTIFSVITLVLNLGSHWSLSNYAFVFGMILADYKLQVDRLLEKSSGYLWLVFFIMLLSYVACFYFEGFNRVLFFLKLLMSFLFPACFFVFSYFKELKGVILEMCGIYSLEIFVLQGIVFTILRNNYWEVDSWLFILLSILGTVLLSLIFHPLFTRIMTVLKENK